MYVEGVFDLLKVTTLSDNNYSENQNLIAEHGLSVLIESGASKFIFDFGASEAMLSNASQMNIDLSSVGLAVCSHSHYDHGNGFPGLVEEVSVETLITGEGFFDPKYAFDGVKHTYLGINFDATLLEVIGIKHQVCLDIFRIDSECYVVGGFKPGHAFETIPSRFVKKSQKGFVKDGFSDEVCLVLKSKKGLVVVVGCAHPGIINMLESISQRFSETVYAVLGGTHLVEADEERILLSVQKMKELGVKLLGLSHCSGEMINKIIEKDQDVESRQLHVGDSIIF